MSRAFGRKVIFTLENKEIKYPELDLEFEVNFNTDSDGNVGHVRFFNISNKTIDLLKKDTNFTLRAGYKNDVGLLLPGVISYTQTSWDTTDKITEIVVGDNTSDWLNTTVNQTWRAGIRARDVAVDLIDMLPFGVGEINLANNIDYPKGKTFSGTIKAALEEIAKDAATKLHVGRSKIYLRPEEVGTREIVNLNQRTGLIASPQKIDEDGEEGYKVQSLLNYRIWADSIIRIESKTISGLYRVKKGLHKLSSSDFLTEMEVVKA
jgi:hypothetical protein